MANKHNRFNYLLALLLLRLIVLPIAEDNYLKIPLISMVYVSALLFVLWPFIRNRSNRYWFLVIAGSAFFFDFLSRSAFWSSQSGTFIVVSAILHGIFLAKVIYTLSRELFREKEITTDVIKGGICLYILIGILWGFFYGLADYFFPGSFSHPLEKKEDVYYFSFVTLFTIGYGDFTPTNAVTKTLATLEALCGQIFLGVFIARLVGIYTAREMAHTVKEEIHGKSGEKTP